jgi:hypothetical protein
MKDIQHVVLRRWSIVLLFALLPVFAFAQVNLTFSVDMTREIAAERFDPTQDTVVMRGSLNGWGGTDHELLVSAENDSVYEGTFEFTVDADTEIEYKFVIVPGEGGDVWEGNLDNRRYTVTGDEDQTLPQAIFNVASLQKVTFWVDMVDRYDSSEFDPTQDTVVMRGTFPSLLDPPGSEWSGSAYKLEEADHENSEYAYKITLEFADIHVDKSFQWKFVIIRGDGSGDIWQGDPNREYTLDGHEQQELPLVKFDAMYGELTTAAIYFQVDIRTQELVGNFNAGVGDAMYVRGNFNSWSEDNPMTESLLEPGIWVAEFDMEWVPGTNVEYKYWMKAGDGRSMPNDGWEFGANRTFAFTGDPIEIPLRFWSDIGLDGFLAEDVEVTFRLDMRDAKDDEGNDLVFTNLWIAGAVQPLFWVWDHLEDERSHLELTDEDEDGIYEVTITFPSGSVRDLEYKYAVDVGLTTFLQESGFQENRLVQIPLEVPVIIVLEAPWGSWDQPPTIITSVDGDDNQLPKIYSLEQNYPNPFNPATVIKYNIPEAQSVMLKVYNILGQEVATLVNEVQNPGTYQVTFDASRLASGLYIYRLQAGSYSDVKRMTLVK